MRRLLVVVAMLAIMVALPTTALAAHRHPNVTPATVPTTIGIPNPADETCVAPDGVQTGAHGTSWIYDGTVPTLDCVFTHPTVTGSWTDATWPTQPPPPCVYGNQTFAEWTYTSNGKKATLHCDDV